MASNAAETLIGAAVIGVAGAFLWYAAQQTGYSPARGEYPVQARFSSAEGLHVGAEVRLAGVRVGTLTGMELDRETYQAVVTLSVSGDLELPDDSEAKVATEGLLGGTFVELTPGGSSFMVEPGGELIFTQGAISLLNLLMKFATSGGEGDE